MSDIGGARVRLDGDARGVLSAVAQSNVALKSLETNVAQNWWGLRNLSLAFAALPAAAAAGMGLAVRSAIQFETAMAGVERTTYKAAEAGETKAQADARNSAALGQLTNDILEIARVTPVATTALAGISEAAGALGVAQEDVGAFTKVVADLAATTNLTEEQAGKDLAGIAALTGLSAAGYDNLASAILETGRQTAATETEITGAASKIASIAGVVGLSTDQVIGLAGALKSARVETSSGSTAIIKAMLGMKRAVEEGGPALDDFAKIANVSGETLRDIYNTEGSAAAFTQFIQGLGEANNAGENLTSTMEKLGLTDIRVLRSLYNLGAAQAQNANENAKLSKALGISKEGFINNTAITEIAEKRYKTFQSQVQILKNNLFELGIIVGNTVLPVLKVLVEFALDIVTGLRAVNPVVRNVTIGLGLLVAVMSGVVAVAISFGAKMALALGSLSRMQTLSNLAGGGLRGLTAQFTGVAGSANAAGVAINNANLAMSRTPAAAGARGAATAAGAAAVVAPAVLPVLTKTGKVNVGATTARQTAANAKAAAEAAKATENLGKAQKFTLASTGSLGRAVSIFGKVLGVVGVVLTGLTIVTSIWGDAQRKVEEKQKKLFGAQKDLTAAMREQAAGAHSNVDAWVQYQLAQGNTAANAKDLGIELITLQNIIKGDTSSKEALNAVNLLAKGQQDGKQSALELGGTVATLARQYHASAEEANVVRKADGNLVNANAAAEQSFDDLGGSTEDATKKLKAQAEATSAYIEAVFSERTAQLSLTDAIEDVNKLRVEASRKGEEEARIIASIAAANRDEASARRDAAEAYKDLQEARAEGLRAQRDAEEDLYQAQRRQEDLLLDIKKAEKDLTKLRAGPTMKELIAATNKLRDAQLKLRDSTQLVEDAEWQLQYLREEGSSARDITDAENTLESAQQDVAESTEGLTEATDELNELRSGVKRAEEIADAERALRDMYHEVGTSALAVQDAEKALADIRSKNAADTFYVEAQQRYQDAQARVQDAIRATRDAERELQDLRNKNYAHELAKAELALEQQMFSTAKAIAERRKQQELMKDGAITAKEEATILAEELERIASAAPNSQARNRLLQYAKDLRGVPDVREDPNSIRPPKPPPTPIADPVEVLGNLVIKEPEKDIEKSFRGKLPGIGALIGGLIGSVIPGVGTAIGLAVGTGFGYLAGHIINNMFPEGQKLLTFENAAKLGELFQFGLFAGLLYDSEGKKKSIVQIFTDIIINPFKKLFGIESPSKLFFGFGLDMIAGLLNGLIAAVGGVLQWFVELPGRIIGAIGDIFGKMIPTGKNVVLGIMQGIGEQIGGLGVKLREIYNSVIDFFKDAGGWLKNAGENVVQGLINGLAARLPFLQKAMSGVVAAGVVGPAAQSLQSRSPSRVMMKYGAWAIEGLQIGLEQNQKQVIRMMEDFSRDLAAAPGKHPLTLNLEPLQSDDIVRQAEGVLDDVRRLAEASADINIDLGITTKVPTDVLQSVSKFGSGALDALTHWIPEATDSVAGFVTRLPGLFTDGVAGIRRALGENWPEVLKFFQDLPEKISEFVAGIPGTLARLGADLVQGITAGISSERDAAIFAMEDISKRLANIPNKYPIVTTVAPLPVDDIVQEAERVLSNARLGEGLDQALADTNPELVRWLEGLYTTLTGFFSGAASWLGSAGKDLLQGLHNGLVDSGDWFKRTFTALVQALVPDVLQRVLGISSPSSLMAEYGGYIVQGLALGIRNEKDAAISAMEEVSKALADTPARYTFASIAGMSNLTASGGGLGTLASLGAGTSSSQTITNNATYNLEAITTAEPTEIISEFMWAQQIKTRD